MSERGWSLGTPQRLHQRYLNPRGSNSQVQSTFVSLPQSVRHNKLIPTQKPPGTLGRPVELVANFFRLATKKIEFIHYDLVIKFKPGDEDYEPIPHGSGSFSGSGNGNNSEYPIFSPEQRFIRRFATDIMKAFVEHNPDVFLNVKYIYDGFRNVYTLQPLRLPNNSVIRVGIKIDDREKVFFVSLRKVADFDSACIQEYFHGNNLGARLLPQVMTAFEIFFKFLMAQEYEAFQRKFFDIQNPQRGRIEGDLCSYLSGFISSVRPTQFGLALNIHLKTAVILSPALKDMTAVVEAIVGRKLGGDIGSLRRGGQISPPEMTEVNRWICGLKVFTTHGQRQRTYVVNRLEPKTPFEHIFKGPDGRALTVAQYFAKNYGIDCRLVPMVRMMESCGILIPMELCNIGEKQFFGHDQLGPEQQQTRLKLSTYAPAVYFGKVANIVEKLANSQREYYEDYGIELDVRPAKFDGRELPAPENQPAELRAPFHMTPKTSRAIKVAIFGITGFDREASQQDLEIFVIEFEKVAKNYNLSGIDVVVSTMLNTVYTLTDLKNVFVNVVKQIPDISMLMVGLPRVHALSSAKLYQLVKFYCDTKIGLISQCFHLKHVRRSPRGYFDNLLLKINGKLGGFNNVLLNKELKSFSFDSRWTQVIGFDVNHPGQNESGSISVVGGVGSLDQNFARYTSCLSVQKRVRNEIIEEGGPMVSELLEEWRRANGGGLFPRNVIIYRDGVSEGQLKSLETIELPAFRQVIMALSEETKLTYVIVQKGHHTRFVRSHPNTEGNKLTLNVSRGTVVDSDIIETDRQVFYLNSHFSPMGTSKPAKYVVLADDLKLSSNELQRFCYLLCYNSTRTREVSSIPVPIKYADLCAYRAKLHVNVQREFGIVSDDDEAQEARARLVGGPPEDELIRRLNRMVVVQENLKNRLYYC